MSKKQNLRTVRTFSTEFKKAIVFEFEKGNFSVKQLCSLHELHCQNVYSWIRKYSTASLPKKIVVEMKDSTSKKLKEFEKKLKEYERIIGQKQIEIDYLNKICELASEHYGEDIKKNLNTPPSKP